ncbi:glutaredoxin family protein [Alkalicoccus chagannorensis]|uniref:glutaredoxin family protein n=1 Tax=Alkalicoccus chagannorensis TaxID=427072 RepID=UPI0004006A11|nr:glutaredoxin family protein [Alkalicoccus chagannorensis]
MLYFYTKPHCPLCDKAELALEMAAEEVPFTWERRNIESKDEWMEAYMLRIPVLTDEAGLVIEEGIITYGGLKQALADS